MGYKNRVYKIEKVLIRDGYIRIAPEVYMRIVPNRKVSEKHFRMINEVAPKTGTVRLLRLTEKQFKNIYMVTGKREDYQEKIVIDKSSNICYKKNAMAPNFRRLNFFEFERTC